MADFQQIRLQGASGLHQILLRPALHIAGQKESGLTVSHHQHQRGVVCFLVRPPGPQHLNLRLSQPERLIRLRHGDGDSLPVCTGRKRGKARLFRFRHRRKDHFRLRCIQRAGQTARMILMRMGAYHIVQHLDSAAPEHRGHHVGIRRSSAVHQHVRAAAADQHGVRLPHIQKQDRKRRFRPQIRRLSGRRDGGRVCRSFPCCNPRGPGGRESRHAGAAAEYAGEQKRRQQAGDPSFHIKPSLLKNAAPPGRVLHAVIPGRPRRRAGRAAMQRGPPQLPDSRSAGSLPVQNRPFSTGHTASWPPGRG